MALQPAQHRQHRCDEVTGCRPVPVGLRHQVDGDLGVGVALELDAGGLELGSQTGEILDDAVVDHRELAAGIAVRMRVAVGGTPMGRPAGVPHTGGAFELGSIGFGQRLFQVGQSAGAPPDGQTPVAIGQSDTGRVVAAVFHPSQRVDHDVAGRPLPDIADDSTHGYPG